MIEPLTIANALLVIVCVAMVVRPTWFVRAPADANGIRTIGALFGVMAFANLLNRI